MDPSQFDTIRRKLANLVQSEETSTAMRAYLNVALQCDIFDVIHDDRVDCLHREGT